MCRAWSQYSRKQKRKQNQVILWFGHLVGVCGQCNVVPKLTQFFLLFHPNFLLVFATAPPHPVQELHALRECLQVTSNDYVKCRELKKAFNTAYHAWRDGEMLQMNWEMRDDRWEISWNAVHKCLCSTTCTVGETHCSYHKTHIVHEYNSVNA